MKATPGTDSAGGYDAREISRMLGLSVAQVRAWVRSGLLDPERGPDGELRFSQRDLELLRAASGLVGARIGPRRVERALSKLKEQVGDPGFLSGIRIAAEGRRIVVTDGAARWQPESGQTLLDFEGVIGGVEIDPVEPGAAIAPLVPATPFRSPRAGLTADRWYEQGCELEASDPSAAQEAYRRALAADPTHADAHVNLGRLLHEAGEAAAAETHYREALAVRPDDATAAFDLGVALEDLGRDAEAVEAYEKAVALDPCHADAFFNLAGACERLGRPAAAIRHLKAYRALVRSSQ
jgi:Tetratricopeptide repeat/MerR HTH family regulatory protein/TPR repeat